MRQSFIFIVQSTAMSSGDLKLIMRGQKQSIEVDAEMTQMIELFIVDTDMKTVTVTTFYMCEKIEGSLSMLSRNIQDIY